MGKKKYKYGHRRGRTKSKAGIAVTVVCLVEIALFVLLCLGMLPPAASVVAICLPVILLLAAVMVVVTAFVAFFWIFSVPGAIFTATAFLAMLLIRLHEENLEENRRIGMYKKSAERREE